MKKMWKKALASILTLAMVASSFTGFATEVQAAENGTVTVSEQGDRLVIGNEYISREFSTEDGKLSTVKITNKRTDNGDTEFVPAEGSEEFIIKMTKEASAPIELPAMDRTGWTATADSYHNATGDNDGPASNLLNDNLGSIWHTNYGGGTGDQSFPYNVIITLNGEKTFRCFSYTPRQQGEDTNGNIKGYELWASTATDTLAVDDAGWTKIASGDFVYNGVNPIYVNLEKECTATQLKFVATSAKNGNSFAGGAAFNLHEEAAPVVKDERHFSASDLELDGVPVVAETTATINNVEKTGKMITFNFKPYEFKGVEWTISEVVVMYDGDHFMRKYMEISVPADQKKLAEIDYIDLESMKVNADDATWTIPTDAGGIVEMDQFKANLGQPIYIQGMFFGCEFPETDTQIAKGTGYMRYYTGKNFERFEADNQLTKDGKYVTWQTVAGAARSTDNQVIQADFFDYIYSIATPSDFRIQYNSWFDNMMLISDETILESFIEIDKELNKVGTRPLDSYVVDDGWINYNDTSEVDVARAGTGLNTEGFWAFNSKFPEGLTPSSELVHKFGSNFGVWVGPRGGYNFYGHLANIIEKAGNGSKAGGSIDVADSTYHNKLTEMFVKWQKKYGVNYWKWDGFADRAQYNAFPAADGVPGYEHDHMIGGYSHMYHVTDLWEGWIDIFEAVRKSEKEDGINKLWLSLTCYVNPSPWFLQWANSVWIQCTADQADAGSSSSKMDRQLTYRDACYYDFLKNHEFQFPLANIYNHDPVYGVEGTHMNINTATDVQFQNYLYAQSARGTSFWELYYSDSIMTEGKYEVTGEFLGWAEENHHMLRNAKMFGEKPNSGTYLGGGSGGTQNAYGFAGFDGYDGIITIRNAAQSAKTVTMTFDRTIGVPEDAGTLQYHIEHSHNLTNGTETTGTFEYGKEYTFTLQADEVRMFRVSQDGDTTAPKMTVAYAEGSDEIIVKFDEKVSGNLFKLSSGSIEKIVQSADDATYHIYLAEAPKVGGVTVTALNIKDMAGNAVAEKEIKFTYNTDNKVPADTGLNSHYGFTVAAEATEATEGVLVNQGSQYALGINAEGKAYFTLGEATAVSDEAVEAGAMIVGVKENNGILKLYVDGELAGSAYDAVNADKMVTAAAITAGANAAGIQVYDIAYGYDKVADLAVEKPEPETPIQNEKISKDGISVIVSGTSETDKGEAVKGETFTDDEIKNSVLDGNNTTFWVSNDSDNSETEGVEKISEGNVWLKLDLGKVYKINQVDYTPRWNDGAKWACSGNIKKLNVEVSKDGDIWTPVADALDISAKIAGSDANAFPLNVTFDAVEAQYVRITGDESHHHAKADQFITVGDVAVYKVVEEGSDPDVPVVPDEPVLENAAKGKTVTAKWTVTGADAATNSGSPAGNITNDVINQNQWGIIGGNNSFESSYFQVDLAGLYELETIKLWRYWTRTYDGTVIVVSDNADFENSVVIFNSDSANKHGFGEGDANLLYEESAQGKEFAVPEGTEARYVRVYMAGSTEANNADNHVVELQAWGYKLEEPVVEGDSIDALIEALAEAENIDESLYTEESLAAYKDVIADVTELVTTGATAEQIATALAALETIDTLLVAKPADYTALAEAIAEAETVKAGTYYDKYTEATRTTFEVAYTAAKEANDAETKLTIDKQADVDALTTALTEAMAGLEKGEDFPKADYTALNAAIAAANEIKSAEDYADKYTEESRAAFEAALTEAAAADKNLTIDAQDTVDAITERLTTATGNLKAIIKAQLTAISVKTEPKKAYKVGDTFDPTGLVLELTYDDETTKTVEYSADNASEFTFTPAGELAETDTTVTIGYGGKEVVIDVTVTVPAVPEVNKEALVTAIAEAEALTAEEYTADSWEAMQAVLANAKVIVDAQVSQNDVDAVTNALKEAVAALEEKPAEPEVPQVTGVTRLAGARRYHTSIQIADVYKDVLGVDKFAAAIVATGENFADALPGSYLAYMKKAPIILTKEKEDYMKLAVDYIEENVKAGAVVYILGGDAVVPTSVDTRLEKAGFKVERLAGSDRYRTNIEILKAAGVEGGEILVATGEKYADSLSASATGKPILMLKGKLNKEQKEYLATLKDAKFQILGGESAVTKDMVKLLEPYGEITGRIAGEKARETSVKIAETYFTNPTAAVIASAKKFPDGLCGGPLAAELKAPLLLTQDGKTEAAEYAASLGINAGYVLGGTEALGDETAVSVYALKDASEIIVPKAE